MRKLMIISLLAISFPFYALGETIEKEPQNEFSVSYGFISYRGTVDNWRNVCGGRQHNSILLAGSCNIDYTYHVTKWLGVGADLALHYVKKEKTVPITFMPTAKFNWLRRKYFTIYSRLSIGFTYDHNVSSNSSSGSDNIGFNLQLSPFGIEAGNKHIRGFTETGLGQGGLIQIGLRLRY